jgi:hypothetical protein
MVATRGFALAALLALPLLSPAPAQAQAQAPAVIKSIYSCEVNGKRLTSDRPIAECLDREQKQHTVDGSIKRVVPPTLTAEERADAEARDRDRLAERARCQEAIRSDRNLTARFPNEAVHRKARETALDDVRGNVRLSEARVKLLMAERKPLLDEAEFYVGKTLPIKLKGQLDANDASLAAQRTLIQNQETEVGRINARYDLEQVQLRKLWAGAPAGGACAAPSATLPTVAPVRAGHTTGK